MPSRSPVELRVGGHTYRVIASTDEVELQRLASVVDERLRQIMGPQRQLSPQALLLAAISLAHDLEQERERSANLKARSAEMLGQLLARIDSALDAVQPPPPAVTPSSPNH